MLCNGVTERATLASFARSDTARAPGTVATSKQVGTPPGPTTQGVEGTSRRPSDSFDDPASVRRG